MSTSVDELERSAAPIAVDLFSGVGGMSLGFERAGFDVVLALDHDPIHVEAYARNFPSTVAVETDLAKSASADMRLHTALGRRSIDVLFGGPPCQGFSYGGKRAPDDPRNELLDHFARLVVDLEPRYFVMENVAGLVSKKMVHYLETFIAQVRDAGYGVVEPVQVLNAADYDVPQRRHRVFVLGYRADETPPRYPLPLTTDKKPTVWDAIGDLPNVDLFDYLLSSDVLREPLGDAPSGYAKTLRALKELDEASGRSPDLDSGVSGSLRTKHSSKTRKRFSATDPGSFEPVSRFYRLPRDGSALTLRAGSDASRGAFTAPRPIHPIHARCITVREAARLHGFPDWFQFHPTKWHGFRQIGNSVPPPLAFAVASGVIAALRERNQP